MADPRAFLGGLFGVGGKGKSIATSNGLQMMQNFCHAANPNNPASTRVGAGLKMLTGVSKAMGKGGKLPVSIDSLGNNTKWILGTVGINSQTLFAAGQAVKQPDGTYKSPTVIEAGMKAAQGVFDKVKAGKFTINDIPLFHPPLNALYEYQQNVEKSKVSANTYKSRFETADPITDHPLPWAADLDPAMPKYKFLFAIQIKFNAPYLGGDGGGTLTRQLSLVAKKATRPGISYDMDDVNYYNFRTKVVTKSEFEEMTLTFYDDSRNSAQAVMAGYMSALSPIVNASVDGLFEQQGMLGGQASHTINSTSGQGASPMSFTQPYMRNNSGSTGPLKSSLNTVIKEIKLFQIYDNGRHVNIHTFVNPRIKSFGLDDLDMSSSEISTVEMKFVYESLRTELSLNMADVASQLSELTSAGKYAMSYNGENTNKLGNTQYGKTQASNAIRNSCLADATNMISGTIGAVSSYMKKLF